MNILHHFIHFTIGLATLIFLLPTQAAEFKIVALHPILGDLTRRIAGDDIEVVDMLKPNGNLHAFEPTAQDIREMSNARLVIASGKHIEPYLSKLKDSFPTQCQLINVGDSIPDVYLTAEEAESGCCCGHHHSHENNNADHDHLEHHHADKDEQEHHANSTDNHNKLSATADPHWWHSMDNITLACDVIAQALISIDEKNAEKYQARAEEEKKKAQKLKGWALFKLMSIPQDQRILAIGHAALGHFCKELNFKQLPVQGVVREDEGTSAHIAHILSELKEHQIHTIFPEFQANPKVLEQMAKTTGAKIARPIVTDGTAPEAHTYDSMYKYNVTVIAEALCPKSSK